MFCIGISHHTASLSIREKLAPSLQDIFAPWRERQADGHEEPAELAVLSTCNRLELYIAHKDGRVHSPIHAGQLLSIGNRGPVSDLQPYLYTLTGMQVVEHLCRVAAGLDSQVVGETQILGQVVEAHRVAVEAGAAGPYLAALFQAAIRAGKRAHAETSIGRNPVSIGSAAITAVQQTVPDIAKCSVLVIGSGEMATLAVRSLLSRGTTRIFIANRTPERAGRLASTFGGVSFDLGQIAEVLPGVDVVICATRSDRPLINQRILDDSELPEGRRLLLVDISLPRNVDLELRDRPGIRLIDLDDLKRHVDQSHSLRRSELPRVMAIIEEETAAFKLHMRQMRVRPVITDLRHKAEAIREKELKRAVRRLGPLDDLTSSQLERFSRSLVNKLLHDPTSRLRELSTREDDLPLYVQTVRELFGLEERNDEEAEP